MSPQLYRDLGPQIAIVDNLCVIFRSQLIPPRLAFWDKTWDGLGLAFLEMPLYTIPHHSPPSEAPPAEDALMQHLLRWLLGRRGSACPIRSWCMHAQGMAVDDCGIWRRRIHHRARRRRRLRACRILYHRCIPRPRRGSSTACWELEHSLRCLGLLCHLRRRRFLWCGLFWLDIPSVIDPGVDGVNLPAHDLVLREFFVQIAGDIGENPPIWQVKDDLLQWLLGGHGCQAAVDRALRQFFS
ncbi:hypothetical protein BDY21DRAFT_140449 [Lineolata rhizophorae]|uniref:Uncharacterized protein n=1 Tax=Lineolata rhizophorae TaxID=578093 RepID=A0A6A6PB91_9PEZI|nr:hypothetical protein BDY21DRAFT_140449 [Lineolata rhizophorae]